MFSLFLNNFLPPTSICIRSDKTLLKFEGYKKFRIIHNSCQGLDKCWVLKGWTTMAGIKDISNLKHEIMGLRTDMKFGDELIRQEKHIVSKHD